YTMSIPIAISTTAKPTLNATIRRSPNPTRFRESALSSTTRAADRGRCRQSRPASRAREGRFSRGAHGGGDAGDHRGYGSSRCLGRVSGRWIRGGGGNARGRGNDHEGAARLHQRSDGERG